eukprot:UN04630
MFLYERWYLLAFICKNKPNFEIIKIQLEIIFARGVLRIRPTRHSKAQNASFVLPSHYCVRMLISGYHVETVHKNGTFCIQKPF